MKSAKRLFCIQQYRNVFVALPSILMGEMEENDGVEDDAFIQRHDGQRGATRLVMAHQPMETTSA